MEVPFSISGTIIHGYGRGGKQLGFPTANIQPDNPPNDLKDGVYYGWSLLSTLDDKYQPMVMSIGNNPQFNNIEKSFEVHILNNYNQDFYGTSITVIIIGYIRPMMKFENLQELIKAIENDIKIAKDRLIKA